jgi:hypothetical protein
MDYHYLNCCVNWASNDVSSPGGLSDMINGGRNITRKTFIKNVGLAVLRAFETMMGYPFGRLTMASDWAVSYEKGKLHGFTVYWVNHSAIEYVFVPENYTWTKNKSQSLITRYIALPETVTAATALP